MKVPDVLGLTETAAIRVLASLSLKAEKAVETVTNHRKSMDARFVKSPRQAFRPPREKPSW